MSNKRAVLLTVVLTIVVLGTVSLLNGHVLPRPETIPGYIYKFPATIATINAICSIVLIASFIAIKNKRIEMHKRLNITAMALSAFFLVLYILTHFFIPDTPYGDIDHDGIRSAEEAIAAGSIRYIYYGILGSHIMLAAVVFPMVLMTFHYGWTNQVEKHKRLARYTFPLWLYVTITGVVVYFMIAPYYSFS